MLGRAFLSWGMTWMLTLVAMPVLGAQERQADALPDEWLAARDRDDSSSEEDLDFLDPSQLRYWFAIRLGFRQRKGTAAALIEELAKAVRDNPADADAALRYLAAVRRVGLDKYDPAWIGDVAKPEFVVPCYDLGRNLARLRPKVGIPLLLRSLELKYSDEDQRIMKQRSRRWARAFDQSQSYEQMIRDGTRHELMYAYKKAGDARKAQALLEELTERYPNGIPPAGMAQFAGRVQAASGARVIESRVRKAEPEKKDSYKYWQRRGQYFAGRKDRDKAIKAYEKALELAKPAPREIEQGQGENFARALVLGDYVRLLGRNGNGMRLLWRELKATDPKTAYATRIVRMMLDIERDNTYYMEPDDARLWAVLEARPKWGHTEGRLLMRFAKNAQAEPRRKRPDKRSELWTRGEKLAKDAHPSRAENLGWVMTRYGGSKRAIPLLTDALSRYTDDEPIARASFALFEVYLDVGNWRAAEEAWPAACKRLQPHEQPAWLGRISVLAAKGGDHADALRIWKKRMNYDLTDLRGLDSLAETGMRDELVQLYKQLGIDDPDSIAPDAALRRIERDDSVSQED